MSTKLTKLKHSNNNVVSKQWEFIAETLEKNGRLISLWTAVQKKKKIYCNRSPVSRTKRISYQDLKKIIWVGERAVKVKTCKFRKFDLLGPVVIFPPAT